MGFPCVRGHGSGGHRGACTGSNDKGGVRPLRVDVRPTNPIPRHTNARLNQKGRLRLVTQHLEHGRSLKELAADPKDPAHTQALCWLLDELLVAEDDLLALVARPGALVGWRRERLGEFCRRVGEELVA